MGRTNTTSLSSHTTTPAVTNVEANPSVSSLISSDNQLNFDNSPQITLINGSGTQIDPITEVAVLTQVVTNVNIPVTINSVTAEPTVANGPVTVAHSDTVHVGNQNLGQAVHNLEAHGLAHEIAPSVYLVGNDTASMGFMHGFMAHFDTFLG